VEGSVAAGPLLKTSNKDPLVLPDSGVPKVELAPEPLWLGIVELKAELGAALPVPDDPEPVDPELAGALSDWASAARGHERAKNVANQSRLEIMKVVEENPGAKNAGWVGRGARS